MSSGILDEVFELSGPWKGRDPWSQEQIAKDLNLLENGAPSWILRLLSLPSAISLGSYSYSRTRPYQRQFPSFLQLIKGLRSTVDQVPETFPRQVTEALCFYLTKCKEESLLHLQFEVEQGSDQDYYVSFPTKPEKYLDPFLLKFFNLTGILDYHTFTEFHTAWLVSSVRISSWKKRKGQGLWRVRHKPRQSRPKKPNLTDSEAPDQART